MTKILIIEDETPAAQRLARLIKGLIPEADIVAFCDSIHTTVEYLKSHAQPDLIMLDIQLGDGISFDIFSQVKIDCPVIFTTAYDEYAIKAFELNSIDYLLKPINPDALSKSIDKFHNLHNQATKVDISALLPLIGNTASSYKKRFLIAIGERLIQVNADEIAYFYSLEKNTFLVDKTGMYYAIEQSLDKLEQMMEPQQFFRVNRQLIISNSSIAKIFILSKSRIKLTLNPPTKEEVYVSNARTHQFREWLDQ